MPLSRLIDQTPVLEEVHELSCHWHNWELFGGLAVVPDGETHRCDWDSMEPFRMVPGNDTYGDWVQVLGSEDTPVRSGALEYDMDRIMIHDVSSDRVLTRMQFGFGPNIQQIFLQQSFTNYGYRPYKETQPNTFKIRVSQVDSGQKAWARCWVKGVSGGYIDFYVYVHEYPCLPMQV